MATDQNSEFPNPQNTHDGSNLSTQQLQEKQQKNPTNYVEAFKSQTLDEYKQSFFVPCSRIGYMYGIGLGLSTGLLRFIKVGNSLSAGNYAVGGFVLFSFVARKACIFQKQHYHEKVKKFIETENKRGNPNAISKNSTQKPTEDTPTTPTTATTTTNDKS